MSERFAVVIPALDAEPTVPDVVRASRECLEPVVVVDDGSSDRTGAAARSAGATVLRHEVNRGKGAALKTGFAWALERGFDGVISLDADGQHLPADIPRFLAERAASGADLVVGGRAHLFAGMLPRRRNANRFSAWSISWCAGVPISDSQSGFRLYSARLLRALSLHADGFDLESEVLVRAGRGGFRIAMIPIELGFVNGIATSHYRPLADTLRIAWTVARVRFVG